MQGRKSVFGISTKHVQCIRMYKRNIRNVKLERIRRGGKPGQRSAQHGAEHADAQLLKVETNH
jgi:hypothetical protein